jgi:predicted metal-dependent hydrolase
MPRKKLRIVVTPNMAVRADAPDSFTEDEILKAIQSKAPWIARQLDEIEDFHPLPTPHQYISGETFMYLGRQYRLRVEQGEPSPAKLRGQFLYVSVKRKTDSVAVMKAMDAWYRQRAEEVFQRYLDRCIVVASRHGVTPPRLSIRNMRTRWGSCAPSGRITLNINLIQAPVHCIEYVVMHELCHLVILNHSKAFFRLLTRCLPDWKRRQLALRSVVLPGVQPSKL